MNPRRLAVVDVGSNSTRLFLCTGCDAAGPCGERITTVTGLRRGAGADGAIADAALARLDEVLTRYAARIAAFGAERCIPLGTSAVRDAPNRHRVADLVEARLGTPLRVLSGGEEARLAFAGARLAAPEGAPVLVVDIGGGSTELVRGGPGGVAGAVSLQLGAVRGTERHLRHDPPLPGELAALREEALPMIRDALSGIGGPAPMLGVAGTVTTLAAVRDRRYDPDLVHGARLTRGEVEGILARLAAMPVADRRRVPGLEPARAPVIVAGAAIALACLEAAGAGELSVSERDLLDGAVIAEG